MGLVLIWGSECKQHWKDGDVEHSAAIELGMGEGNRREEKRRGWVDKYNGPTFIIIFQGGSDQKHWGES